MSGVTHSDDLVQLFKLRALAIKPVSLRRVLSLNPMGEALLRELLAQYPNPVKKGDLYGAVTGLKAFGINTEEVHVSRLRKALERHDMTIHTICGEGYELPGATAARLFQIVGAVA